MTYFKKIEYQKVPVLQIITVLRIHSIIQKFYLFKVQSCRKKYINYMKH